MRLAGECESYVGLDFSGEVLRQLKGIFCTRADLRHVELREGLAHELSFMGDDSVDLVIVNSVVQYFPDVDYLLEVLQEAVRVTQPGATFLWGCAKFAIVKAYYASVQLYKAEAETTVEELRRRIREARRKEEELLIDGRCSRSCSIDGTSWVTSRCG